MDQWLFSTFLVLTPQTGPTLSSSGRIDDEAKGAPRAGVKQTEMERDRSKEKRSIQGEDGGREGGSSRVL